MAKTADPIVTAAQIQDDPYAALAALDAKMAIQGQLLKCPNDNTFKFHKAEFVQFVNGVEEAYETTYRCVSCHTEYWLVDGQLVNAG